MVHQKDEVGGAMSIIRRKLQVHTDLVKIITRRSVIADLDIQGNPKMEFKSTGCPVSSTRTQYCSLLHTSICCCARILG